MSKPVISDEAVEAAAKASWDKDNSDPWISGDHDDIRWHDRRAYLDDAMLMLEAAAPHMLAAKVAEAKANHDHIIEGADGYSAGFHYALHCIHDETNPYRSQV